MMESEYFNAYLNKNHNFKEIESCTINFPEEDPEVMKHVLKYLEDGKLDPRIRWDTKKRSMPLFTSVSLKHQTCMACRR